MNRKIVRLLVWSLFHSWDSDFLFSIWGSLPVPSSHFQIFSIWVSLPVPSSHFQILLLKSKHVYWTTDRQACLSHCMLFSGYCCFYWTFLPAAPCPLTASSHVKYKAARDEAIWEYLNQQFLFVLFYPVTWCGLPFWSCRYTFGVFLVVLEIR